MIFEFSWERPFFLFLCLLIPAYVYFRWRVIQKSALVLGILQYSRFGSRLWGVRIRVALESLLVVCALLAMSSPYTEEKFKRLGNPGIDILLTLDISASMQAADLKPSRLEVLKQLTADFIRKRPDDRIGLILFAGHVFTQSTMTTDHSALQELVSSIRYDMINHASSGGTAIGDALLSSVDMLKKYKRPGRDQVLVLISDGQSDSGSDPEFAAKVVAAEGIRFFAVGIGGKKEVYVYIDGKPFINSQGNHHKTKLDDTQLKKIASIANGRYFRAFDEKDLQNIFEELDRLNKKPLEVKSWSVKHYRQSSLIMLTGSFWFLLILFEFFTRRPLR